MKKKVLKLMSAICIATGLISIRTIPASAANYSYPLGEILDHKDGDTLSVESWQWFQRADGTWGALRPDGSKPLVYCWVLYKGNWYYLDSYGKMVENGVVWCKDGNLYYMKGDGTMLTNSYISYQFYKDPRGLLNFYADASGALKQMD